MAENETFKLIEQAIELVQKKKMNELADNNIKTKTANVITYDKENCTATISLVEDRNNNEYRVYNKSGEDLTEGDVVKVFYTTNVAKGWIETRMGRPVVEETPPQYISQMVKNQSDVEIEGTTNSIFNADFEVLGTDSDVVFNANQQVYLTTGGKVDFMYEVDNDEEKKMSYSQSLDVGRSIITHVYPMRLDVGTHNINISMVSSVAKGITESEGMAGVISGQIGQINETVLPNYKTLYYLDDIEENTTINIPRFNSGGTAVFGTIDWGDGTVEENMSSIVSYLHTYEKAGNYKISIDIPVTSIGITQYFAADNTAYANFKDHLRKVILSDNITKVALSGCYNGKNLNQFIFGKNTTDITNSGGNGGMFSYCTKLTSISFPNTLQVIFNSGTGTGQTPFYGSGLKSVTLPTCKSSSGYWFSHCPYLTTATIDLLPSSTSATGMFKDDTNLRSIKIGKNTNFLAPFLFENCTSLTSIDIPNHIKSIGSSCFQGTGIQELVIPKETVLADHAFYGAGYLKKVTIGGGKLPSMCFQNNDALETIIFKKDTTGISKEAFYSTVNIKTFIIEDGDIPFVIEAGAFNTVYQTMPSLTSVTLPDRVSYYPTSFPSTVTVTGGHLIV